MIAFSLGYFIFIGFIALVQGTMVSNLCMMMIRQDNLMWTWYFYIFVRDVKPASAMGTTVGIF